MTVAQELIGKRLTIGQNDKEHSGILTETEAYVGKDDPACHASRGRTKRTEPMFARAGHAYVYLIYGIYHCLNIVTEDEGFPAAVLIRGVLIDRGPLKGTHLDGPGKLCRDLSITKDKHNGIDIITDQSPLKVYDTALQPKYETRSRIGISKGQEKPWRFIMEKETIAQISAASIESK